MGLVATVLFGCILYVQPCFPRWLSLLNMTVSGFIHFPFHDIHFMTVFHGLIKLLCVYGLLFMH